MRPIDLLQGEAHATSMVNQFAAMGCFCTENLSVRLAREWGAGIRLASEFPGESVNLQQLSEADDSDLIVNHFMINSQIQTTLLISRWLPSMLVDIACGGRGEIRGAITGDTGLAKQRLTVSESHMLNRLMALLNMHYAKALEEVTGVTEISFTAVANSDIPGSHASNEPQLIHTIKMSLGVSTVDIHFIISKKNFSRLQMQNNDQRILTIDSQQLKQAINTVPVSLTATLCEYTSSLREIRQLQPGDFIPIRMSSVASIHSGGHHLFNARVVKQDNRLCLQMLEPVTRSPSHPESEFPG